jgi:hypothetical protein
MMIIPENRISGSISNFLCYHMSKHSRRIQVKKRLEKHNKGQIKSTKSRDPFDLIYVERYNIRREAMFKEWTLKSTSGIEEKKSILKKLGL